MKRLLLVGWATWIVVGCGDTGPDGAQAERSPLTQRELVAIAIETPTAWWLRVAPDGSGRIGYGSSMLDEAGFPSATFDFPQLRDRLWTDCTVEGAAAQSPAATFVGWGPGSTESRYCSDPDLMASVFERGVAAAEFGGTRLGELYTAQPPVAMP